MRTKTIATLLAGAAFCAAAAAPPITISAPAGSTTAVIGVAHSADEKSLLERVVAALSSDPGLRGAFVTVTVEGESVKLTGTANTPMQAAHAEEVATAAAGPVRVVNEVRTGGLQ